MVPAPLIDSVEPDSAKFGEQVIIQGSNFGALVADNTVTFNGVEAIVSNASTTRLLVEVPKGAGNGPVEVSVDGQTATGPEFDYLLTVTVSTFAGTGVAGFADGDAASAQFNGPVGLDLGPDGDLFVVDNNNHRIRRISPTGEVSTWAGNGTSGDADGAGPNAQFDGPLGIVVSGSEMVYVADLGNHLIRQITSAGAVTTLAGDGTSGYLDGVGTSTKFSYPGNLDVGSDGAIYVADRINNRIRKISSAAEVTTLAGSSSGYSDGNGAEAQFNIPFDVAVAGTGDLIVADGFNHRIRQVTPSGVVTTVAGTGSKGLTDGPADQAEFNDPYGVAVSDDGTIFVADYLNRSIRMISDGIVTTLAGDGTSGHVDGDGADARFNGPFYLTANADGSVLYVSEYTGHRIRKITLE